MERLCPICATPLKGRQKTCSEACRYHLSQARKKQRAQKEPLPPPVYVTEADIMVEERPLRLTDVPDCIFPSDNADGIPLLRPEWQARWVDMPFLHWGGQFRREIKMTGTYHFYTEDRKFPVKSIAYQVINSNCRACVEPNYSIHAQSPRAVAIGQIYQKRWLSRYWQCYDIRILVDMHVPPQYQELNLLGVPKGWRAYATRATQRHLQLLEEQFTIACERAESRDILFVVYGGGREAEALAQQHGWLWFDVWKLDNDSGGKK